MFDELSGFDSKDYSTLTYLKFLDIRHISDAQEHKLKDGVWYPIIEWLDGSPIIELSTTAIFTVLPSELDYVEIQEMYPELHELDILNIHIKDNTFNEVEDIIDRAYENSKKGGSAVKYARVNNTVVDTLVNSPISKETINIVAAIEKENVDNTINALLDEYSKNPTEEIKNKLIELSNIKN